MRKRDSQKQRFDDLMANFPSDNGVSDVPVPIYLTEYEQIVRETWKNCDDFKVAMMEIGSTRLMITWLRGLVDRQAMQIGIFEPLTGLDASDLHDLGQSVESRMAAAPIKHCSTMAAVSMSMASGCVVIYQDGLDSVIGVDMNNMPGKAIEASQSEPVIEGPQEAFTESLDINVAMLRRRFRNPKFKVEATELGELSRTTVSILYVEGLAPADLVVEVRQRLSRINIDAILDINMIREMTKDAPWSPFPTTESTERPDKVIAGLVHGRIAIAANGATHMLLAPTLFVQSLMASEDMYSNFWIATPIRLLRHIMFWSSILLPSLYVSLLSYQQDLIPTPLLISLIGQHEGIPFPTVFEAFLMQFFFEALREAGQRLPRAVGQSVSIVGGLVIGDAAVNAGIVSPGMVIVVAATGISSFTIASYTLVNTSRVLQFVFLLSSGVLGLYGVVLLGIMLATHMVSIRSYGVPYMAPYAPMVIPDMKDSILRAPWWLMRTRPQIYSVTNEVRNRTPQPRPQTDQ